MDMLRSKGSKEGRDLVLEAIEDGLEGDLLGLGQVVKLVSFGL